MGAPRAGSQVALALALAAGTLVAGTWAQPGAWAQTSDFEPAHPHDAGPRTPGPMSAIDWLRDSAALPPGVYPVSPQGADGWDGSTISMQPIGATSPESVGLFAASRVGLPTDLWGPTPAAELAALISALPTDTLPALRDLTYRLLLAEFDPPVTLDAIATAEGSVFLAARIERLKALGALDQAAALLDTLDSPAPELREDRFRIALLLGDEGAACRSLTRGDLPAVAAAPRVFCLARQGDWGAADALLHDQRQQIPPVEAALLARFLEVDLAPGTADTAPPARPGPLAWHLLEAIGEPLSTQGLPLAFAHADLRGTAGWRAQIEAGERLVRTGALSPNRLLGLYTERSPAASGGIWERVRAVQRLEAALDAPDTVLAAALTEAWTRAAEAELELALSALFAPALRDRVFSGAAADIAHALHFLGEDYEGYALDLADLDPSSRWQSIAQIARGLPPTAGGLGQGALAGAVAEGFADPLPPLPEASALRLSEGRLGEDLLRHLVRLGPTPDPRFLTDALITLRHLRLEDIARRTAIQALLLDRRG